MAKMKGKVGPNSVDPSSKGTNPAGNSGGMPGYSCPQKPIPGPTGSGQPPAMRKALAKKSPRGSDATGNPGLVR